MSNNSFHPYNLDAVLATIQAESRAHQAMMMERMKNQDLKLDALIIQTTKTNGRVNHLEMLAATSKAKLAGMFLVGSAVVSALVWIVSKGVDFLHK